MEKLVRVPFDVETAKKITEKSVDGRIVTREGYSVRILCWDKKDKTYPIAAFVDNGYEEDFKTYTNKGIWNIDKTCTVKEHDLFLEIPEYMAFKDGDIVVTDDRIVVIRNPKIDKLNGLCFKLYVAYDCKSKTIFYRADFINQENARFATETEKQKLIDTLKESKEPKAKEYLKRFFGIEEKPEQSEKQKHKFHPFDKVLVRDSDFDYWRADIFSHYINNTYLCIGAYWSQCIKYEGNEHLLGTIEKPE